MQREIKFRAWDYKTNKFIYFDNSDMWDTNWLDTNEISQFTGLKDKNGKEIYEGDIVEAINNYHGKEGDLKFNAEIIYNSHIGQFQISYKNTNDKFVNDDIWLKYFLQIIGNVHENPELLKS